MRKKSKLLTSALCLIMIAFCLGLTSCGLLGICSHQWSEWSITKHATCKEAGVRERTCALCGNTESSSITATEHVIGADDGDCTTEMLCLICGEAMTEAKVHVFDNDCDTYCNNVGCEHTRVAEHIPNDDDGDCTTDITCSICGEVTAGANWTHTGGSATCRHKAECEICGTEYGELAEHTGEAIWVKRMGSHYQAYSCCYGQITDAEEHKIVDGACTECGFNPTITVSSLETASGETQVVIAVSIADNPGITGLTASVQYNSDVLTLTEARSGEALNALTFTKPSTLNSGCTFMWDGLEIKDGDVKDGDFLILTFDITADAPEGEYSILLKITAFDNDLNRVTLRVVGGKVTIKNN